MYTNGANNRITVVKTLTKLTAETKLVAYMNSGWVWLCTHINFLQRHLSAVGYSKLTNFESDFC